MQGPEEFVEGLATGVKSLFGHTVGGAAGAVSRITGTLGKGIAALTLDEEYQRRRQEAINRRPANFTEGMAQGAKGLATVSSPDHIHLISCILSYFCYAFRVSSMD